MTTRTLAALLLGSAMALQVFAQDPVRFEWKPAQDTTYRYQIVTRGKVDDKDVTWTGSVDWKIVSVAADGNMVVEQTWNPATLRQGDTDLTSTLPTSKAVTLTVSRTGDILLRKTDMTIWQPRLASSSWVTFPTNAVNVGDKWTITKAADTSQGLFGRETTYVYDGRETIGKWDTCRLKETFRETDATPNIIGDGTLWVSVTDGSLVKAVFNRHNVMLIPGSTATDTVTEITRIE